MGVDESRESRKVQDLKQWVWIKAWLKLQRGHCVVSDRQSNAQWAQHVMSAHQKHAASIISSARSPLVVPLFS